MEIKRVCALYFSATGNTEKTVAAFAETLAEQLGVPWERLPFTKPAERERDYVFADTDLVVVGTPTYAGRVPNVLLPYLTGKVRGSGTPAVPVVLFGNRAFDDSLMELRNILTANGFMPVAAAFVGEHSFSRTLGAGRPNAADMTQMDNLARAAAQKIQDLAALPAVPVPVAGQEPLRPYYTPRDRHGAPINILKVKPRTDMTKCSGCGLCAVRCPMGSIDPADVSQVNGICIKCCACVKGCPSGAKYFDDPGYLYHQHELEDIYSRPAENALFAGNFRA